MKRFDAKESFDRIRIRPHKGVENLDKNRILNC